MSNIQNSQQQGYPQQQYPQPPTNTLAIISLVTSLVFAPAGIVTGHIALSQIKKSGESGRGLAIAGVIIGWVQVGFAVLLLLFVLLFSAAIYAIFWQEVNSGISDPLMISLLPALL